MSEWIGLAFFVLIMLGTVFSLKILSRPITRTTEEFERNAAEGTTALGATMNALQELMNPEEAKAKETIVQMKDGRYQKKKREGKANGHDINEENKND